MRKIFIMIGTRPDAIKMAPICHALRDKRLFDVTLVSTGQHRDLVPLALESFDIKPDIYCEVTSKSSSLSTLTADILYNLNNVFTHNRPDLVLTHGDTSSCYAAGLASFYQQVPFYHVEAGLRSYNIHSPFPEEFHRRTISMIATHHFSPTNSDKDNLIREGINENHITVTGNTIHEAILSTHYERHPLNLLIDRQYKKIIILTLHRRENIKQLQILLTTIKSIALKEKQYIFIFPVHPNPAIQNACSEFLTNIDNVMMIAPQNYKTFISLLYHSDLIVTDSGGIQEEAAYLGKHVFILRDIIERNDGLSQGYTKVIGLDANNIKNEILNYLHCHSVSSNEIPPHITSPTASAIIVEYITRALA